MMMSKMRRPGYLRGLGGEYFEVLHERSAEPIYVIRDRLHTNTGEEWKAKHNFLKRVSASYAPRNWDFLLWKEGAPVYR